MAMLDLYDLIHNICKRPAMYLGHPSLSNLRTFLAGYTFARRQQGLSATDQEEAFTTFPTWLQQQFPSQNHPYWDQLILAACPNDRDPWDFFVQLFQEFTTTTVQNDRSYQTEHSELVFK
jgi:hypothetical protein